MGRKQVRLQVERELARRGRAAAGGIEAVRARLKAARLSEAQLLCLTMLWYHDLSQEEISLRLRISQQAVSRHLYRGLERLAEAGIRQRRRRRHRMPEMYQAPPTWLDQLAPDEVKAGW